MTHIGKIGRLSKDRRHELGQRIENGEPGVEIVNWLNTQPDVQEVLAAQFAGRPISEQNLSDWKQCGHLEWLRRQEAREAALGLVERADDLDETTQSRDLSDRFATVMASEMTRLAAALLEQDSDSEKRWQRLCQIHRELSQLRRDDHRAAHLAIQRERWDLDVAREHHEEALRQKAANKERMMGMLLEGKYKRENADLLFGGGESGRNKAEMLYRLKCDLPIDDLLDGICEEPGTACPRNPAPTSPRSGVSAERRQSTCPQNPKPTSPKEKPAAKPGAKPKFGTKPKSGTAKKPSKPQKSSQLKANQTKTPQSAPCPPKRSEGGSPIQSAQVTPSQTVEYKATNPAMQAACPQAAPRAPIPEPRSAGVPPAGSPGVSLGDGVSSIIPIIPMIPTPPTKSDPTPANPVVTFPNPAEDSAAKPAPLTASDPGPDPEKEAFNRWFRMNRGAEPFDPAELQRLYAAIPPKET